VRISDKELEAYIEQSKEHFEFLDSYEKIDHFLENSIDVECETLVPNHDMPKHLNNLRYCISKKHEDVITDHAILLKQIIEENKDKKCYVRVSPEIMEKETIGFYGIYTRLIFV